VNDSIIYGMVDTHIRDCEYSRIYGIDRASKVERIKESQVDYLGGESSIDLAYETNFDVITEGSVIQNLSDSFVKTMSGNSRIQSVCQDSVIRTMKEGTTIGHLSESTVISQMGKIEIQ